MALEKNIKEVNCSEADFIANAANKNDGFLTDVTGFPMVIKRGTNIDYFYPTMTRDNLGNLTYNKIRVSELDLGDGFSVKSNGTELKLYLDGIETEITLLSR